MDGRLTPARFANPVMNVLARHLGEGRSALMTPRFYYLCAQPRVIHIHFTLVLFGELSISHSIRSMWRECDCYPVDSHERFLWGGGRWSTVHSQWKCSHQVSWLWWGEWASDGLFCYLNPTSTAYTSVFLCLTREKEKQRAKNMYKCTFCSIGHN